MVIGISRTLVTTNGQSRVDVAITGDPGALTVTRTVGGVVVPVRGADGVDPVRPFVVTDWEVPAGSAVYSVTSTAGNATAAALTVPASDCVWLVPLVSASTGSVEVILERHANFGPAVAADVRQPLGGGPAVVATSGLSSESGEVVLRVQSAADYSKVNALAGKTIWVSHDPAHGWGPFYAVLLPDAWSRFIPISTKPERTVTMRYFVQPRPTVTTTGVVTGLDVAQRYATGTDLAAAYPTGSDLLADSATWTQ